MELLHTDEQTLDDIRIFSKNSGKGIYDIYNHCHTRGGEAMLQEMFRHPLSDSKQIRSRSSILKSFAQLGVKFPFDAALLDMAEKFLASTTDTHASSTGSSSLSEKETYNGITAIIELMQVAKRFASSDEVIQVETYTQERVQLLILLEDPVFEPVYKEKLKNKIPYAAVTAFDTLFRIQQRLKIEQLLHAFYLLDVYLSIAKVAVSRSFVFPEVLPKGETILHIDGLYHPELEKPVANNISMHAEGNVVFLTGANMAGKSTFLRSVSTAVYIAHIGFPVAASKMTFSVMDGIYTTINLPDNLGIGASHFYAEVLRLKKIAAGLQQEQALFVIFDELFRGTNVKDAHEATIAITSGFATKKNSLFIISSHIVEAGEALSNKDSIRFLYLPTHMNGHTPKYTYKLEQGVTDDRHGMIIIRNEGILDILEKARKR